MVHLAAKTDNTAYVNAVLDAYLYRVENDKILFGENVMQELPQKAVAVVSSPLTAILCTMNYLQVWEGAEVPVWVATNGDRLNEAHILGLKGRDCYFYPTATQYTQWQDCVSQYREILGNVAYVNDGLFLANRHCPKFVKDDSDLSCIVTLPFETASLFMSFDMTAFYKRLEQGGKV